MRTQILSRQKELGIVPPHTELPDINPLGTPEIPNRAGRQALPADGLHQALGRALR